MLEIRKTRTSPRNPRGNGQSERFNRTLLKMIKAYLCGEQRDWDLNLGCLAGAYRASPHSTTKFTPNFLTLGRELRMPAEVIFGSATTSDTDVTSYGEYVDGLRSNLRKAHEIAREHIGKSAKKSKDLHDNKMVKHNYNKGDPVWCLSEAKKLGICPKLEKMYAGPFMIKNKMSEVNFVLQLDKEGKERLVHHNKLKKFEGSMPRWMIKASKKLKKE